MCMYSYRQLCFYAFFPIYATIPCKSRRRNIHGFYSTSRILPPRHCQRQCQCHDSSAPSLKKIVSITLHECPPLRLLLRSNITSIPVRRSSIRTMPTIITTIVSVAGRITRVATIHIIIPGWWIVLLRTIAVSVGARGVVST